MKIAVSVVVYAAAILAANIATARYGLVPVGFSLEATAGTYAAGFALLARDFVHRYGGVEAALVAVAAGAALSWLLADPRLAVASTIAFVSAELVDLAVFAPLRRRRGFVRAALLSNVVSAPIDTVVFLAVAGFPITAPVVLGQLVGKIVWATCLPLAMWVVAQPRDGVATAR